MSIDFKDKKILVADDTNFMRSSLIKLLIEIGFSDENIHPCDNGKAAYDALNSYSGKFDAILSDWNMPKMNGLEFLKNVRQSEEYYKNIPFVLITTVSEKEKVIEALGFGVTAYILKPIQATKITEIMDRIFTEGY